MKPNTMKPEANWIIIIQVEENMLTNLSVTPLVSILQQLELHSVHKRVHIFLFFLVDQIL